MRVHGTPGASADRLQRRRLRHHGLLGWGALLVTVALVAVGQPMAAVVPLAVAALLRRRLRGRAIAADRGADAEIEAARRLRRVKPTVLLFDVDVRGRRSDIDAVLLGPMATTVEVKAARGRPHFMDDGRLRVGGRWLPGRPLAQAASHAATVGRVTAHHDDRVHVEAVLCVTGMRGRPVIVEYGDTEVWVTNLRHLRRTVRRMPSCLDPRAAREIAASLRGAKNASPAGGGPVH